ncbi:MAG: twin-arginine translocation signal domain-containing protein, partial [Acidobacteriota bacterium]
MANTRRDFLKSSALGVTVSFLAPQFVARSAWGANLTPGKILVVLQLAGGNDTVNTFVPYADSRYRSLRPNLAIADASILKVDSRMGFHPSMSALQTLYENRR